MALTLQQVPGFADVANSNFAAEKYAIGLNFQRLIDNAKFAIVKPEIFVTQQINGDTVTLPTSLVDGYTYARDELTYLYHFASTGSTAINSAGAPSQPGAVRYMGALVDQATGEVSTFVQYLVGNGSAPTNSTDGILEVFTIATRRRLTMVVASQPQYSNVQDTEFAQDNAITESIMQRLNQNAKFAALASECIYMGEFTNSNTVPQPISPADGYAYASNEVHFMFCWRWTTLANQFADPDPSYKQLQDITASINGAGLVTINVAWKGTGSPYPTTLGRITVVAYCKRSVTLGPGAVDFVDMTVDMLAAGRPVRFDVLKRLNQNIKYGICRPEFFTATITNGYTVPLPTSPIDGYVYSREECTYVYEYATTAPASNIRIGSWKATIDQATGLCSSQITRVQEGGGFVTTYDGTLLVTIIAERDTELNASLDYIYNGGGGGGSDIGTLLDGGFDTWNKNSNPTADGWRLFELGGTGYAQQAPGLVGGFAQRLGVGSGAGNAGTLSNQISLITNNRVYLSWLQAGTLADGFYARVYLYNAVGDSVYFDVVSNSAVGAEKQTYGWLEIPLKYGSVVVTSFGQLTINGTLDFTPTYAAIEFIVSSSTQGYVDLDGVVFANQSDPSLGQVAQKGSTSLASFPAIEFMVTDTDFQVSTYAITIDRIDGTSINAPVAGNVAPTTGLTGGTTYWWYPYYSEIDKFIEQVPGDSGTSSTLGYSTLHSVATRDAFIKWNALSNLPLAATPINVTTNAATPVGGTPAPPTGGSGGGDDGCLRSTMYVVTKERGPVRAIDVLLGEHLLGEHGKWLEILAAVHAPHSAWCPLTFNHGGGLEVTTGHPFSCLGDDDKYVTVRAWDLTISTQIPWLEGVCHPTSIGYKEELGVKVKISLEYPHEFYAGATIDKLTLTHNSRLEQTL